MGQVNWLAVVLGAALALAIGTVWYGGLFGRKHGRVSAPPLRHAVPWALVLLLASTMIGHALARLGAEKLAAKPWLYWMQTGGLALAFVMPAVWLGALRHGTARRAGLIDCGYWLVAYLAIGTVFWALR